jgi:hypothetical protein
VRLGEMHEATWRLLNDQLGALIEAFPAISEVAP